MREALKNFLRSLIEYIDGAKQVSEFQLDFAKRAGIVLAMQDKTARDAESQCSHKKAGMVRLTGTAASIRRGLNNGNGSQYAVRKHQIINGDIWIDCLRCGKKWRPPVAENFTRVNWFGFTVPDVAAYVAAVEEYNRAKAFETNNVMSSSIQWAFHDPKTGKRAESQVRAMYAAMGE
jgi:hypothetical protein